MHNPVPGPTKKKKGLGWGGAIISIAMWIICDVFIASATEKLSCFTVND